MLEKLLDFLFSILRAFQFLSVVDIYQRGVVLRLGNPSRDVGPGLVWLIPFYVDRLLVENIILEALPVGPQSLTTKDRKSIVLSTIVSFTIEDVRKFLLEVEGRNEFIEDSLYGVQSGFIMSRTLEELCGLDMENELTKLARRRAKEWGVRIVRVQIADFSESRSIRLIQPIMRPPKPGDAPVG
jgi:regulator of protease activity HflC (stomatin/prohibitin superfamily)